MKDQLMSNSGYRWLMILDASTKYVALSESQSVGTPLLATNFITPSSMCSVLSTGPFLYELL
jgi:hypothetical protein